MSARTAEYPRPNHTIVHLSDSRLLADDRDKLLLDSVDSTARFRHIVERIESSGIVPQAIVVTGDLAEFGEPGAYATIKRALEPIAERLEAAIVWVPGERDDRPAFRSTLLGMAPSDEPIDRAVFVDGLRIITLDTSVPGFPHGEIEPSQLDWLADELATPAPYGTIVAMHHPPIPSTIDLSVASELRNQSALAAVLAGSDVRTILAGHVHYSATALFAGIPVSVASATSYTQDLTAPLGSQRSIDGGQSFNLVSVYNETVMTSVVPVLDAPALSWTPPGEAIRLLELHEIAIAPSPVAQARDAEKAERNSLVWDVAGL